MEARNRPLPDWFERIRTRQISLPRFQRHEAWGPHEVSALLTTVLRGLPAGATLILEVGDDLPFISRPVAGAPADGERITELLLDGQQRLTSLWRALHDNYDDRTYLISYEDDPHTNGQLIPTAWGQNRWIRQGTRYPLWVDDPKQVWKRGYLPMRLLCPGDIADEIDAWIDAVEEESKQTRAIDRQIQDLRTRVREFNIPFLSLPVTTPREVALDVFIKMNTSSVKLTTFDILVAQVEAHTDESLHDLVLKIGEAAPHAGAYKAPEDLVLDVAALMQDRSPSQSGYAGLDLGRMISDWDQMASGIEWMVQVLHSEAVFDAQRLPTDAVLAVLAALHPHLPHAPDQLGNARTLLRAYIWRAFCTGRYDRAAATRALQDYRGLRDVLSGKGKKAAVPIFNETEYPLPTQAALSVVSWPKNRNTLARSILAAALRCGARDIADDQRATHVSVGQREYHHIFPRALLEEVEVPEDSVFRALNCMLITWRTNRTISRKHPVDYLRERAQANSLGVDNLVARLKSHLVPYDELVAVDPDSPPSAIRKHYDAFLEARANLVLSTLTRLCEGNDLA